jgi:hypothetical protein
VLLKTGRRIPVSDLHETFKIPCVYDYVTELCRQKPSKIIRVYMREESKMEKPYTRNIKGSNMAAASPATIEESNFHSK